MKKVSKSIIRLSVVALVALSVVPISPAQANDRDVIREGNCGRASDWKLKLSPENGRLEVEWEVDQNVVGDTWRFRITDNGTQILAGQRTTTAPSGSFEARTVTANRPGSDNVVATATNLRTGEFCRGTATATF